MSGSRERVVVVGAGIVGASVAYHLARGGADLNITLVDDADPGAATPAGAGIVAPWVEDDDRALYSRLGFAAARSYPGLVRELTGRTGLDTGYERPGIQYKADPASQNKVRQRLEQHQATLAPEIGAVEALDGDAAAARFPALRRAPALWIEGAARVDGRLMAAAMRAGAGLDGVAVLRGRAVVEVRGGRVVGVRTADAQIDADIVVLAAGAWTAHLAAGVGASLDLQPVRGQIAHLELAERRTGDWPIVQRHGSHHYLLAFGDGHVVAGATRERVGFDRRATCGGLAEVLVQALEVAPGLEGATVVETRVGFRPQSGDGLPLLGALPAHPNVLVATGTGHYGLTVGPFLGKLAAEIILGREHDVDITGLEPLR